MQNLRISYTLLNLWHSGRLDDVLAYYLKKDRQQTDQMLEGSAWDSIITEQINAEGTLPKEFGGFKLEHPITQPKLETMFGDNIELVTVPDTIDGPTWYEFKTGLQPAETYAHSMQISMYSLVSYLENIPLDRIVIIRYNQYTNETDSFIMHNHLNLGDKVASYIKDQEAYIRKFLTERGALA